MNIFTCIRSLSSLSEEEDSPVVGNEVLIGTGICRLRSSRILSRKSHPFETNIGRFINVSNNCSRFDFDKICWARITGVNFSSVSAFVDFFSSSLLDESRLDSADPKKLNINHIEST
jgi:hypothetical protein